LTRLFQKLIRGRYLTQRRTTEAFRYWNRSSAVDSGHEVVCYLANDVWRHCSPGVVGDADVVSCSSMRHTSWCSREVDLINSHNSKPQTTQLAPKDR